jgi:hypothetical protein
LSEIEVATGGQGELGLAGEKNPLGQRDVERESTRR